MPLQGENATYRWWTTHQRSYLAPFSYAQPHFYLPRAPGPGSHPWFTVLAHAPKNTKANTFMVFVKEGTTWKMSAATGFDIGQPPPQVALDADGYATALDPGTTGLALKPSTLPAAVNDNYLTCGTKNGAVFGKSTDVTQQRTAYKNGRLRSAQPVMRVSE
ncbi:hypothetical protein ACIOHO_32065 [Streptomyces sp. NPDC087849]|uniref:hypothetical protein n=1 Tax=Streptomyces sp. NPDC087849 TaxID=3365808 RepID=UPI003802E19C